MSLEGPKFGEVVRFKKMTKRSFVNKQTSTFVTFSSNKGREAFGLILGSIGEKDPLPNDMVERLNSLGWMSLDQLVETLGAKKAEALFDKATAPKAKPKKK